MIRANRRTFIFEPARKRFFDFRARTIGIDFNGYRIFASPHVPEGVVYAFSAALVGR